jgi:hypothetical protein
MNDVDAMTAMIEREAEALPASERLVIVSDWGRGSVLEMTAADRVVTMLSTVNARILRGGFLVPPAASTGMRIFLAHV